MRISKQTKKTTLAQQGRYLLICLLSMMLLFSGWEHDYSEPDATAGI